MRRMWINQPSNQQKFHYLHGTNVLLAEDGTIYFLAGSTISQLIPTHVLSEGWIADNNSNWEKLKQLAGYVQDGSNETVKLFQDDATMSYFVKAGNKSHYGSCFEEALNKFYLKENL